MKLVLSTIGCVRNRKPLSANGQFKNHFCIEVPSQLVLSKASSEKSVGHRYAPMAAGSSACATLSRLFAEAFLNRVVGRTEAGGPRPRLLSSLG